MQSVHLRHEGLTAYWTPKSACSVVRQMIYAVHPEDMLRRVQIGRQHHEIHKDYAPSPSNRLPGFYVVRHPYIRVISMYTNSLITNRQDGHFYKIMGDGTPKTFRNFCLYLNRLNARGLLAHSNIHFQLQSAGSPHLDGSPPNWEKIVVIRMEDGDLGGLLTDAYRQLLGSSFTPQLEQRLTQFFAALQKGDVPSNTSGRSKVSQPNAINCELSAPFPPYADFIDNELIGIIQRIYSSDYQRLGYEFGRKSLQEAIEAFTMLSDARMAAVRDARTAHPQHG